MSAAIGAAAPGARIATEALPPVLKRDMLAFAATGASAASKRKLYIVPQRIAFAFGLAANASVAQEVSPPDCATSHGSLE